MPDYYIAEDGTIHDREAEHRSRTQHTAAPAAADTTAEDTPEGSVHPARAPRFFGGLRTAVRV